MVNVLLLGLAVWVGGVGLVMATRPEQVVRFRSQVAAVVDASDAAGTTARVRLVRRAGVGLVLVGGVVGLVAVL
jgi:hypothetical protein